MTDILSTSKVVEQTAHSRPTSWSLSAVKRLWAEVFSNLATSSKHKTAFVRHATVVKARRCGWRRVTQAYVSA